MKAKKKHSFLLTRSPSWVSLFTDALKKGNPGFSAVFQNWLWPPGSCFLAEELWWGEKKKRLALHEGVDFVCYTDQHGQTCQLDPGLLVSSVFAGKLVQLHRDFLNWSLYIRHEQFCQEQAILHSVYGHVQPREGLCPEQQINAGEPVALLNFFSKSTVPLHLHYTVAWIPKNISSDKLSWQLLSENEQVRLLDPLAAFDLAYVQF